MVIRLDCPNCNGTGFVEYERVVGGYDPDVWQSYRELRKVCEYCSGSGEDEDQE